MQKEIGIIMIMIAGLTTMTSAYGSEQSAYDSGYNHGCDNDDHEPEIN